MILKKDMLIAIPSKGRAGETTSQKILPNATFFVPKSELHQYEGIIKNLVPVPKETKGITATRNWILKNTKERYIVFIDDDVKSAGYTKMAKRDSCKININDGSYYFNENFKVKEDYEICLRHIKNEGGILGARYIHWENSHWNDEGGCKDYRTVEIERKAIKDLIKMYPGMIRSAKRKASIFTIQLTV